MRTNFYRSLFSVVFVLATVGSFAQLNPFPSQYYYNQMLQSVAATGLREKTRVDLSFRNTINNATYGAPVNQYFSIQSQTANGGGIGLQVSGDYAGLLSRNRVMASYALDLAKGDTRIRLGVGMGVMMNRINNRNSTMIRGDFNDPSIAEFNQQKAVVDGSIGGLIETASGFQVLASIPSLGSIQQFSKYSSINYVVFNSVVKKKINLGEGGDEFVKGMSSIEPMVGYRMVKGGKDIYDLGFMLNYQEWLGFMALYHSNNEFAFGVHIPYKDRLALNFTYNTGKVYSKNYLNVGGTIEGHVSIKLGGTSSKK